MRERCIRGTNASRYITPAALPRYGAYAIWTQGAGAGRPPYLVPPYLVRKKYTVMAEPTTMTNFRR